MTQALTLIVVLAAATVGAWTADRHAIWARIGDRIHG